MVALLDSSGRPSRTLTMVTAAVAILIVKFALAGLSLPLIGDVPAMGAAAFGGAFAAILAPWIGREYVKK